MYACMLYICICVCVDAMYVCKFMYVCNACMLRMCQYVLICMYVCMRVIYVVVVCMYDMHVWYCGMSVLYVLYVR